MNTFSQLLTLAQSAPSAAGAAIGQVIIATIVISGVLGVIAALLLRHRAGKPTPLTWAADTAARISGLPHWVALPSLIVAISLLSAVFGVYWDVSLHIDNGRDDGPLANLAHYPILFGLVGLLAAGWLAMALPKPGERPGPAAVKIAPGWYAPVGGIVIAVSAAFGLAAFPLDDVWHRLFGQDVTLWGPTHLMMIGGAVTTLIGQALLLTEASRSGSGEGSGPIVKIFVWSRRIALGGALLLAVDVFAMEFNYGIPQFAAIFHPALLAFGAAIGLVAVRYWAGPGAALAATAFFLVVRWVLVLLVGPIFDQSVPAVPLFIAEAVCVELVAIAVIGKRSVLTFGLISGIGIGTFGFAAQYAYSQFAMPLPWQDNMLPEGLIIALVAGLAGGVLGALLAAGLKAQLPGRTATRVAALASVLGMLAIGAYGLSVSTPQGNVAVTLDETSSNPRQAFVEARFDDPDLAAGNDWTQVTSWQGGGLVVNPMEEVSPGVWRTTEPIPIDGNWKAAIRIADGTEMAGMPIFLPEDPAIPAPEVAAPASFTRELTGEKQILQREAKDDVSGVLWTAASLAVLFFYLGFLAILAWGVGRVARSLAGNPDAPDSGPTVTSAPQPRSERPVGRRAALGAE